MSTRPIVAVLMLVSADAFACPMCFSDGASGGDGGVTAAMLTLLLVTVTVLSGVAAFGYSLYRREIADAAETPADAPTPLADLEH